MAIAFIALAVMLVGGLGATTGHTALQKAFAQFKGSDRCVSEQFEGGGTSSTCVASGDRKSTNEIVNTFKNDCKEAREEGLVEKCSGSQTGNGEFCNWVRVKGDTEVAVFGGQPPCNDERHLQKDLLQK